MEHGRITVFSIVILFVACLILTGILVSLSLRENTIDGNTVENLIELLEDADIEVSADIINRMEKSSTVYVCNSADYNVTVASLLADSEVSAVYSTPEGEIVLLENGARVDFEGNFRFHFYLDETVKSKSTMLSTSDIEGIGDHPDSGKTEEITWIVSEFLGEGSSAFGEGGIVEAVTDVGAAWENQGAYYVLAHRSIDGISIADNAVLCMVENGRVVEAYGTWSFLVPGESYKTDLCDSINLLLAVKKELEASAAGHVIVESVSLCYSLYLYGEGEDFCLIPCWQVITSGEYDSETRREFIYNAIDCTLYTK